MSSWLQTASFVEQCSDLSGFLSVEVCLVLIIMRSFFVTHEKNLVNVTSIRNAKAMARSEHRRIDFRFSLRF